MAISSSYIFKKGKNYKGDGIFYCTTHEYKEAKGHSFENEKTLAEIFSKGHLKKSR